MRSFLFKNKTFVIVISVLLIISIGALSVYGLSKHNKNGVKEEIGPKINMILLGEETLTLNLKEEYIEEGIILLIDEIETLDSYETIGKVDTNVCGEYILTYKYQDKEITRKVIVVDNVAPTIKLKGNKSLVLAEGVEYKEYGYIATDNIDGDITLKVEVMGEVKKTVGTYTLTYNVKDAAGNLASVKRTIKVNKKMAVKQEIKETKDKEEVKPTTFKNEVMDMIFTDKGFKITGTNESVVNSLYLLNPASSEKKTYSVNSTSSNYSANIDLSSLANGKYEMYLAGTNVEEKIKNNLNNLLRIKRKKIGSKLVTINYPDNTIQIVIENHVYKYDILIDVGHGGSQPGAVNATHIEKNVNLTLSLYEKERYESHGLKVLMTRTGDAPSLGEGDADWRELSKRSYAMGYHGVVSKIIYSNHHNSYETNFRMGPEIIVPASLSNKELVPERKLMDEWINLTPLTESHVRFYTRDYDTGIVSSKANGEIYSFTNYYAVIRIPYNLFNVKSILFEPAYMSNDANWNWYWNEENWKKMCEAKIKIYVESIGIEYKPPVGEIS